MRTTKINAIEMDAGETIEVSFAGAVVKLRALDDDNGRYRVIEVETKELSAGFDIDRGREVLIADEENMFEEVRALRFITFWDKSREMFRKPREPRLSAATVETINPTFLNVAQLRALLEEYPPEWAVHLDVSMPEDGWEGERVVRPLLGVRQQAGYHAVALDAAVHSVR